MLLTLIVALGLIAWEAARDTGKTAMGSVIGDAETVHPSMVLPPIPKTAPDMRVYVSETMVLEDPDEMKGMYLCETFVMDFGLNVYSHT